MKKKPHGRAKRNPAKSIPLLPDLEIAKAAVINSLSCPNAQRGYRHAIDEFVDWYCSEPRLSFSKTVVVRYRMHLAPLWTGCRPSGHNRAGTCQSDRLRVRRLKTCPS
jgi:hypothetical protein